MAEYRLTYDQPYEFDDGSEVHDLCWAPGTTIFDAADDESAIQLVETSTTNQTVVVCGKPEHRKPTELVKIVKSWATE